MFNYRFLLKELVIKGIKLKYRRSYLGILWSLIEPLLTMVVLTVVFGQLLGNGDRLFPVYILTGRLLYTFFSTSTKTAMRSIRANSAMIKKVYLPKYLYPVSSCIYTYVIFLISLLDLILVMFLMQMPFTLQILWAIVPIFILFFLALGVSMILSTIAVFFRDLEYLWDVILMLIMYTCAIFYKIESFKGTATIWVFKLNPLYGLISNFRACLYGTPLHPMLLLYAALFSIATCVIGTFLFYKQQDKFILHI
ncbi:MAG: ABC transporter permease [Oscillospiraceae bacterium]